jgi:hypothetical protein
MRDAPQCGEGHEMHRLWKWVVPIVVLAFVVLGSAGLAAEEPPAPKTPDASLCNVTGRTSEQLERLRAYVATRLPAERSEPAPIRLREGPPADPETRAAITAVVDELFACLAAGQPDRAFLLASDARLVRGIADPDEAVAFVAGLAAVTPVPIPTAALSDALYAGPWEVRQLADGRVSAAVWLDSEDEHPARGVTSLYVFVFEDGEWRLDDSYTMVYGVAEGTATTKNKKKRRSQDPELVYVADLVGWPEVESRSATPSP